MIKIEKAYRRKTPELCTCCLSYTNTKRIFFLHDGCSSSSSVVLCEKCRNELVDILEKDKE